MKTKNYQKQILCFLHPNHIGSVTSPMNPHVRLFVCWLGGWSVGWMGSQRSVFNNLKAEKLNFYALIGELVTFRDDECKCIYERDGKDLQGHRMARF